MNETGTAVERREAGALEAMSIDNLVEQVSLIQKAMHAVMRQDEHYGVIPGTQKPTLLKPGAEKLCLLFRLGARYDVQETFDEDGHYSARVICTLFHIPSGNDVGQGPGSCTTKESRYAYRNAERVCPACGEAAIIKGKAEYGGGWVCFKRKGGCGAKYPDGDELIEQQKTGKIANPDLPDVYNTVLKMASKRALVAAVLNATAASDIFTQDVEDMPATETRPTADADTIATLRAELAQLADYRPDLWEGEVVVRNASQRFGRNIRSLDELTPKEAEAILNGARKWAEQNPPLANEAEQEVIDPEEEA